MSYTWVETTNGWDYVEQWQHESDTYDHYGPSIERFSNYNRVAWQSQTATREWDQVLINYHLQNQGYYQDDGTWIDVGGGTQAHPEDGYSNDYWQPSIQWYSNNVRVDEFEDRYHYDSQITYNTHDIWDTRNHLNYTVTNNTHTIIEQRPVYQKITETRSKIEHIEQINWITQTVYEERVVSDVIEVAENTQEWSISEFSQDSLQALSGNISMNAGGKVRVSGLVSAKGVSAEVNIHSGTSTNVGGILPEGVSASETLAATARITAAQAISITTTSGNLEIEQAGELLITNTVATSDITLTAGIDLIIDGSLLSHNNITLDATADIELQGEITTANRIQGTAGRHIAGTLEAILKVTEPDSSILFTAQNNIDLDNSDLEADAQITLTATSGSISHLGGRQGIVADNLTATASTGITANTVVATMTLSVTSTGNISITEKDAIELTDVQTHDGSINIVSLGNVTAEKIITNGIADHNDISITVIGSNLQIGQIETGTNGDVTLFVEGSITQDNQGTPSVYRIQADHLEITVSDALILDTDVNTLTVRTSAAGDVTINEVGAIELLDIRSQDGDIIVNAAGDLVATHVESLTNRDENDITLTTSTGDILVGYINAGIFVTDEAELEALKTALGVTELTVSSLGDITLTATSGAIYENADPDSLVDIIADELTLIAATAIGTTAQTLEIAANILVQAQTSGSIGLYELDSYAEVNLGLILLDVTTVNNAIYISAENSLSIGYIDYGETLIQGSVQTTGQGEITLTAKTGYLLVYENSTTDSLQAGSKIVLDAQKDIILKGDVTAPDHLEFITGASFITPESQISFSADTIIIHSADSLTVDGTLSATDKVELVTSRGNLIIAGDIIGKNGADITQVILIARGNQVQDGEYKDTYQYQNAQGGTDLYLQTPVSAENLDLIPVLQRTEQHLIDRATGFYKYEDQTGQEYLKSLTQDLYYRWNGDLLEQVMDLSGLTLTPVIEEILTGNIYLAEGSTIEANNHIQLNAQCRITGLEVNLTVTGAQGSIDLATGADLILEQGANLKANKAVKLASTEYIDVEGFIQGGDVIINGVIEPSTTTNIEEVELIAYQNIELNNAIAASHLIKLYAGNSITGAGFDIGDMNLTVAQGTIDIAVGQDITYNGNLMARDKISLSSLNGNMTVKGTLGGVDSNPVEQVVLQAAGDLNVDTIVNATQLIEFKAGGAINDYAAGLNLTAAQIDLSAASLNITSVMTAQERVTLAATNGDLTINSSNMIGDVEQVSLTASNNLTITGTLSATDLIKLFAGNTLNATLNNLTAAGTQGVIDITAASLAIASPIKAGQQITLTSSNGDLTVSGTLQGVIDNSLNEVILNSSNALTITQAITALDLIQLNATGTITTGNLEATAGNIVVDTDSDLTMSNDLQAGQNITLTTTGQMTLVGSDITAGNEVTLEALSGSINHSSGHISAVTLKANALSGMSADTIVDHLTAQITGTGNLILNESDGITLTQLTTQDGTINVTADDTIDVISIHSNGNDISLTTAAAGSINLGVINAGTTGDVTLNSAAAIIDTSNTVYADALSARANDQISLNTEVTSLDVETTVGDITITETDAITLTNLNAASGSIMLTAGEVITVTQVDADQNVSLTTTQGDILIDYLEGNVITLVSANDIREVDGFDGAVDVKGSQASFDAQGAIGSRTEPDLDLEVELGPLTIQNAQSDISLNLTGDVVLDIETTGVINIISTGTITATNLLSPDITLVAADIRVDSIDAGSTGTITLNATGSIYEVDIHDSAADIVAKQATLTAGNDISGNTTRTLDLETSLETLTATAGANGSIIFNETDEITLTNISANNGAIIVTAAGAITATVVQTQNDISLTSETGSIIAGNIDAQGDVTLNAASAITSQAATKITANDLTAVATGEIALNTQVVGITVTSTVSGDIAIEETDAITLHNLNTKNGAIAVTADGQITVTQVTSQTSSVTNPIILETTTDGIIIEAIHAGNRADVEITAQGAVKNASSSASLSANQLTIRAAGSIEVNTEITSLDAQTTAIGDITIVETDAIDITNLQTNNGAITLTAGEIDATLVNSNSHDIALTTTTGNIQIDELNAGASGDVNITSAGTLIATVTANELTANASGLMALTTTINTLNAQTHDEGLLSVTETNDLTLGTIQTQDGAISITATGTINATDAQALITSLRDSDQNDIVLNAQSGDVNLISTIDAGENGDVTLTATGTVTATVIAGDLNVDADDQVTLTTTVTTLDITTLTDISITETDDIETATIVADDLTLQATGAVTLATTITTLDITATGDITLIETDAISITNITAENSSVEMTAADAITLESAMTLGSLTLTNGGLLEINGALDLASGFTQNGTGAVSLGADITTTGANIDFNGTVTLTANVTLDTNDAIAPVINTPADVTEYEAVGPQTPIDIGTATATDDSLGKIIFATNPIANGYQLSSKAGVVDTLTHNAPATFSVGTTTVTWTATDIAGNVSTTTQDVTVVDTTAPVLSIPVDVTVEAQGVQTTVVIGQATATDAVGVISITHDAPTTFVVGVTTVTWTAADAAGNTTSAEQIITVEDTIAPLLTIPADLIIEATGPQTSITLATIGNATATDIVGIQSITSDVNADIVLSVGEIRTITWTTIDAAGNITSDTQTVTVVDTTPPVIEDQTFDIDENSANNTSVGTVLASDVGSGDLLTYAIIGGTGSVAFAIDSGTAELTVTDLTQLDYETTTSFTLTIQVNDQMNLTNTAQITIHINDVNEAPSIALENQVTTIQENTDTTTSIKVADLAITDDALGTETLTLVGADAHLFEINNLALYIKAGTSLDHETSDVFHVTVQIDDNTVGATPDDLATLTIGIIDLNEAPTVDQALDDVSVDEDAADQVIDISDLFADVDAGDQLILSVLNSNGTLVTAAINGTNLTLSFIADQNGSAVITVMATDNGSLQVSDSFNLTVNPVNDTPTVVTPLTDLTIDEDAVDQVIDLSNLFTDVEDSALTLSVVNTNASLVTATIDGTNLVLSLLADQNGSALISITATDSGTLQVSDSLDITVYAVNDAPTVTDQILAIDENSQSGSYVGTIAAQDVEVGPLTYLITDGDGQTAFSIDSDTGAINVIDRSQLNHEIKTTFTLNVEVSDGGGLTDTATLTINLNDINETPVIENQTFTLDENSDVNSIVGQVVASDVDQGDTLTYHITNSASLIFDIATDTGIITVKDSSHLDYESQASITLNIEVRDQGNLKDRAKAIITLNDVNEVPAISIENLISAVQENTDTTTPIKIADIQITDDDLGIETLTLVGDHAHLFEINNLALYIKSGTSLDHETIDTLHGSIQVDDNTVGATPDDSVALAIAITDINETPTVDQALIDVTVDEDAADQIIDLSNLFADVDADDSLTLSVASSNESLVTTTINGTTLTLSFASDQNGSATITVTATDNGALQVSDTLTLTVNPINDAPIVFSPFADVTVDEDAIDQIIDLSSFFTDVDDSTLNFSVINNNTSLVTTIINGAELTLQLGENQNGLATITVTATDSGNLQISDSFNLTVNAINDNPSVVNPLSDLTIDEDATDQIIDLSSLFADVEDSSLILNVINTNASLVTATINNTNLILSLAENQNGLATITVTATDSGNLKVSDSLTLTVQAVNDTPTVVNPLSDLTIDEDAADQIIDLSNLFADVEDSVLALSVVSSNESLVSTTINGTTLTLSLPADQNGSALITVTATDSGNLEKSNSFNFTVHPVNDAPVLAIPFADLMLDEDAADQIIDLSNIFADVDGDILSFNAISSNDSLVTVAIDGTNLVLTLAENQNGFASITVTATDLESLQVSDLFDLSVNPVNDAPVVVDQTFAIAENSSIGSLVGEVLAHDVEADPFTYSIIGGNKVGTFSIDADSGNVTVAQTEDLDFETTPSFTLQVQVTDLHGLTTSALLTINLLNLNEYPVVLNQSLTIDENSANETIAGIVLATDQDAGDTRSYAIIGGTGATAFAIDVTTGEITVADYSQLDYETATSFTLNIQVTDLGGLTDTATLTIQLSDINETPSINDQTLEIAENSANGTIVDLIQAIDVDADDQLKYTIQGGTGSNAFLVGSKTGQITVANTRKLDYETTQSFTLQIQVTDLQGLADTAVITINLTNVNEAPTLDDYYFTIDENSTNATLLGTVQGTDIDANDLLTYTIISGTGTSAFNLNQNTGEITINDATQLDYETTSRFILYLQVTDGGMLTDTAQITIDLNDINETPVIHNQTFAIDEYTPNATSVGEVLASDQDNNDSLSYAITGGTGSSAFAIDNLTGQITVTDIQQLNYKYNQSLTLELEVSDQQGLTGTAQITIQINKVHDLVLSIEGDLLLDIEVDGIVDVTTTGTITVQHLIASGQTIDLDAGEDLLINNLDIATQGQLNATATENINFTAPLQADYSLSLSADNITLNELTTTDNASLQINNAGLLTINHDITLEGSFIQDGTGAVSLGANITTTQDHITFNGAVTLINDVTLHTNDAIAPVISEPADITAFEATGTLSPVDIGDAIATDDSLGKITLTTAPITDGHQLFIKAGVVDTLTHDALDTFIIGTTIVTWTATDTNGNSSTVQQIVTVVDTIAPVLSLPEDLIIEATGPQTPITLAMIGVATATDVVGVQSSFSDVDTDLLLAVNQTRVITWTAIDTVGNTTSDTQTITVVDTTPPAIENQTFDIDENSDNNTQVGTVQASDVGSADALTYAIIGGTENSAFAIDPDTAKLTVKDFTQLDYETTPSFIITIEVTDQVNLTSTAQITIHLNDLNDAPILQTIGDQTVDEETTLALSVIAIDADDNPANTLTYSLDTTSLATGMTIDSTTGEFLWTPTEQQQGEHTVIITVTDNGTDNLTDSETITITVNEINDAPVLDAIGNQIVDEEATLSFTVTAADSNDDPTNNLAYSLDVVSIIAGMTIDSSTGEFVWTPTELQQGDHTVTITVTDDGTGNLTDSETITITVNEINDAPILDTIGYQIIDEEVTLSFTVIAADSNDDPANNLIFTLDAASIAAGMTIDPTTGEFVWTSTEYQDGEHTVTITVTDDGIAPLNDSETIVITVNEVNDAPVIENQSFAVNEYSVNGTVVGIALASDVDTGDVLSYAIIGGTGATAFAIDSATGQITVIDIQQLNYRYNQNLTLDLEVSDLEGVSDTAIMTIDINKIHDLILDIEGDLILDIEVDGIIDVTVTGTITVEHLVALGGTINLIASQNIHLNVDVLDEPISANEGNITLNSEGVIELLQNTNITTGPDHGNIHFNSPVNGDYKLGLIAGTGDIDFDREIALGGLQVTSASNLTFDNTVTVDDEGIDITAGNVTLSNVVTTTGSGDVEITNSGLLTIANAADMTLDGSFTQNGTGAVSMGSSITTTNDNIRFAQQTTLINDIVLSTDPGTGNVAFGSNINSAEGTNYDLIINAGQGNVYFDREIGTNDDLGTLKIEQANDVIVFESARTHVIDLNARQIYIDGVVVYSAEQSNLNAQSEVIINGVVESADQLNISATDLYLMAQGQLKAARGNIDVVGEILEVTYLNPVRGQRLFDHPYLTDDALPEENWWQTDWYTTHSTNIDQIGWIDPATMQTYEAGVSGQALISNTLYEIDYSTGTNLTKLYEASYILGSGEYHMLRNGEEHVLVEESEYLTNNHIATQAAPEFEGYIYMERSVYEAHRAELIDLEYIPEWSNETTWEIVHASEFLGENYDAANPEHNFYVKIQINAKTYIQDAVVSQVEEITQEDIGETRLVTNLNLHQIGWWNPQTGVGLRDSRDLAVSPDARTDSLFEIGVAKPSEEWVAWYTLQLVSSQREITLTDGRVNSVEENPTWADSTADITVMLEISGQALYVEIPTPLTEDLESIEWIADLTEEGGGGYSSGCNPDRQHRRLLHGRLRGISRHMAG